MSAAIVNLSKVRKARARAEKDVQAAENRAKFGRAKSDREVGSAVLRLDKSRLDGAKRANPNSDDDLDPGNVS